MHSGLKRAINWVNLYPAAAFDWLFYLFTLLFSFAVWFPTRYLPFHWDSAAFIVDAANHFVQNGFFPFVAVGSNFSHPPLLPALVAWILTSSSQPILWSHVLMFPFLPLLIFSVYKLGVALHGRLLGLSAALATALTPVVLAENAIVYLDLPSASLALFGLSLLTAKKYRLAVLAVSLAALFKLTALLVIPFFFVYFWYQKRSFSIRHALVSLTPVFIYALWLAYHYAVTGWVFAEPAAQLESRLSVNLDTLLLSARVFLLTLFLDQNRLVLTFFGALALIFLYSKKTLKRLLNKHAFALSSLSSVFIAGALLFILSAQILPRYLILLFPISYLVFLLLLFESIFLLSSKFHFGGQAFAVVLLSLAFIAAWHPKLPLDATYRFTPPSDLRVIDMIRTFQNIAAFIDINHPNTTVFGAFPENFYLQRPNLGYVSAPSDFRFCQDFAAHSQTSNLLVIHPYSPNQQLCRSLLDTYSATLLTRSEVYGTWAEIYSLSATPSATTFTDQVN